MDNPLNISSSILGSADNKGIDQIESILFKSDVGTTTMSNSSASYSHSVVIEDDGIKITNSDATAGMIISDAISFLGSCYFVSKGTDIKKGEYSENPNSARLFTYQETVLMESIPKELASEAVGKLGINLSTGMDGIMPIMTDISAGPLPHFHTISMKHVHRIDPAYLYRIPTGISFIAGIAKDLQSFFSL